MKKNNSGITGVKVFFIIIGLLIAFNIGRNIIEGIVNSFIDDGEDYTKPTYNDKTFSIISSSENKILDGSIKGFAEKNNIDITITYTDTLSVVDKLNSGEKYDAVLISNSIWLSMLDSSVKTSNLRSTSITPVVFGIKESKAKELGFVGKKIYTKDILNKVKTGELKFSMGNPTLTNSGASAYLEVLYNLAGSPEVLKSSDLKNENLKKELKKFFEGITRTSGDEDFLETSFINGDYDAAFTYESSIININKQLEKEGKETLYAIYPVDGVAISDSPFVYIDNKNEAKKENFLKLQEYLLSDEGQTVLLQNGRRTWYGGINENAPKDVFNPNWGINTTTYITPIKYPSMAVIKEALTLYQIELRKPVHVVFCLDYSGSMYGSGIKELRNAMKYILTEADILISFSERDKIDVIPFGSDILAQWSTSSNLTKEDVLQKIENLQPNGSTALYPAAIKALDILSKENTNKYVTSVILMTDGMANVGTYMSLQNKYRDINREIPIYSITFGNADEYELKQISNLTNGKVFDGKTSLVEAFKKVRGYN